MVIVGGGFGGLTAARALRRAKVRVTLVDSRNHHLFQPLLYQVATAGLNPSDIAHPIRGIVRGQRNVEVLLAKAESIDVPNRELVLADGVISWDYLIVATGATHSYFGRDGWAQHAPGLKTVEDALEIRRRVLFAFEAAEREADPAEVAAWLTFCVIGGGPTGVELAGALGELSRHTLAKDFRRIDPSRARVILFEGGPRILAAFPEELAAKALRQLEKLGAEVRTKALVTHLDARGLLVGEERVAARTVLWAAGVAASPLAKGLGVPLDRAGRVLVEPDLTIPGNDRVFVIGDLAAVKEPAGGWVPGVAPAAMQGGQHAAETIRRDLRGRPREPFRYRNKGELATIGRSSAIAKLSWIQLTGFVAWVFWLFIHIYFLIGFRNRVIVFFQWMWAYFTYGRGARLITGSVEALREGDDSS